MTDRPTVHNALSGEIGSAVQVGHAGVVNLFGPAPIAAGPLGTPVGECSPFDLEVHRTAGTGLPTYVPRPHDEVLRQVVDVVVGGGSAIVVLVGGSSTGKTRACWEAVRRLPAHWRLWHPISPGRPEAVLADLDRVGPHTVLWLNEAQHYLLPGAGERVAAAVRELLRDPGRGPVLVLATLWPEYWATLVTRPLSGVEDPHAQARELLVQAGVRVPDEFTAADVAVARGSGDPLLAEAVERAADRQVAQYLAGAPALLERYRTAPPAAAAVIDAAMDARRLGHGVVLSRALLEAAAPGYLSDSQWGRLGDDWFDAALGHCLALSHAGVSPLVRVRPRPGQAGGGFRLEDYLEETGRWERYAVVPPASLWDALVEHAPAEDLPGLAQEAERRGYFRFAFLLHRRSGDAAAVARLLERIGRAGEAENWYDRAVRAGDPGALRRAARRAGAVDEALGHYRRAAGAGDFVAERLLVELLVREKRVPEAIDWLTPRARDGVGFSARLLERLRSWVSGETSVEVVEVVRRTGDDGEPPVPDDEDVPVDRVAAEARVLVGAGRVVDAVALLRGYAEERDISPERLIAHLMVEGLRPDEAVTWFERAVAAGDRDAVGSCARALAAHRGFEAAAVWLLGQDIPDNPADLRYAAGLMEATDRLSDAVDLYLRAVDRDDEALRRVSGIAVRAGRADEVGACLVRLAEAGDTTAMRTAALLLDEVGRAEEAAAWYLRYAEVGPRCGLEVIARLLVKAGRSDEADRLPHYGLEPGGVVARPWSAAPPHDQR
ncbi:tetratricopeptide repeat protein [Saccharothrix syringae]|uniref:Tetratricopeptide repeat protein n=1 Tax=Saccharothrix syringae TaxID=103733 RepID=A0A5Q0H7G8_SACSY|nr:hypothetical protein [Saccharothrix syringae]QFZ21913.1 hypothetical protein EKG83_34935 [Saccharothrix syringae]